MPLVKKISEKLFTNFDMLGIRDFFWRFLAVFIIFSMLIAGLLFNYNKNLKIVTEHETDQYLYQIATATADNLFSTFQKNRTVTRELASALSEKEYASLDDAMDFLQKRMSLNNLKDAGLLDSTGTWHMVNGEDFNPDSTSSSFEQAAANSSITMEIIKADEQYSLVIIMPLGSLQIEKLQMRALCMEIELASFGEDFNFSFLKGVGYANIIDSDGLVIYSGSSVSDMHHQNLLEKLESATLEKTNIQQIRDDIKRGKSGSLRVTSEQEDNVIYYYPMAWSKWYVFVVVSTSFLQARTAALMSVLIKASIGVGITFTLATLFAYVVLECTYRKKRKLLEEDANSLRFREELYRLAVANSTKHVMRLDIENKKLLIEAESFYGVKAGAVFENVPESILSGDLVAPESKQVVADFFQRILEGNDRETCVASMMNAAGEYSLHQINCSLIYSANNKPVDAIITYEDAEISNEKEMAYSRWRQALELLPSKRYRLLEENLSKNTVDNFEGTLFDVGYVDNIKDYDQKIRVFLDEFVCPDDVNLFAPILSRTQLIKDYYEGKRVGKFEFRFIQAKFEPRWIKLTYQLIEYPNSTDIKIYKMYEDIDSKKKKELSLISDSEQDSLTKLFNRRALEIRISEVIKHSDKDQTHAFLFFDIDYFKSVNDRFGHATGDKTLISFAQKLETVFRKDDIVGRIGGDEFVVFMRNVPNKEDVEKKARSMQALSVMMKNEKQKISCSTGIALYPKAGENFGALYKAADKALYRVKENGRGSHAFYEED